VFCQPEIVTSYYARFAEPRVSARHQYEASTWRHEADFTAVVGGCCSWHRCWFGRRSCRRCWHGRLTDVVLAVVLAAAAAVVPRL